MQKKLICNAQIDYIVEPGIFHSARLILSIYFICTYNQTVMVRYLVLFNVQETGCTDGPPLCAIVTRNEPTEGIDDLVITPIINIQPVASFELITTEEEHI